MAQRSFQHIFKNGGWETIETAWNIPERRIYVDPSVPLRVMTAIFVTSSSSNGRINYGGGASKAYQRVQARGAKGQTIQITQTVP